tara:strand:- start:403 stop:693 length:291 start_codon:yes stop_codon:yes gene_type:complete
MVINKSDIISSLSNKLKSYTASDIDYSIKKILSLMSKSLYSGERIEIRGFGTFSLHHHNSRTARNPKTGDTIALESRSTIHFKPSNELKKRVDNKN